MKLTLALALGFSLAVNSSVQAQTPSVYSINAVGYVNVTLSAGFNLFSNPLDAHDNRVSKLLVNMTPGVPDGLKVFVYNRTTGTFDSGTYNGSQGAWVPAEIGEAEIKVGEGVFVFNPSGGSVTLTLVGEVMQGDLSNPLPMGFSIKANQVPRAGRPDLFGLVGGAGDRLYRFNKSAGGFDTYYFHPVFGSWVPTLPEIQVGEAFFYLRANTPGVWNQSFSIFNP